LGGGGGGGGVVGGGVSGGFWGGAGGVVWWGGGGGAMKRLLEGPDPWPAIPGERSRGSWCAGRPCEETLGSRDRLT